MFLPEKQGKNLTGPVQSTNGWRLVDFFTQFYFGSGIF